MERAPVRSAGADGARRRGTLGPCPPWRPPATTRPRGRPRFLTDLAVARRVSASTQSQALAALLFLYREVLYREVLDMPLPDLLAGDGGGIARAKRPRRLPTVPTRA
jgi:hypothetical protein